MPRIPSFIFALVIATSGIHASPVKSEKSAEGERLETRIDAQIRQIAMMDAYAGRLRQMLARVGLDVPGPVESLTLEQKMEQVLPRVHCNRTRLIDAIDGLARVARIEIKVDWKALNGVGVLPSVPINCNLGVCSVKNALQAMLTVGSSTQLEYLLENGAVTVTTTEQLARHVVTRAFDINNLIPDKQNFQDSREQLGRLVTDTVAPDTWRDAGGIIGTLSFDGQTMVVTQLPALIEEVRRLLEQLDIDKENEHRRRTIDGQEMHIIAQVADTEKLMSRCRSAGMNVPPRLDHAMQRVLPDLQFVGTPLFACFDALREASGQVIIVNWKVLQEAGYDTRAPMTLTLRHETLDGAMQSLIEKASEGHAPLQYGTEANAIAVSTQGNFHKQTVTRVYDVRDLVLRRGTRQESIDALIHDLMTAIDPDSWRDAGGTIGSMRELQGQLIVTQSARTQGRVKSWLEGWRLKLELMRTHG